MPQVSTAVFGPVPGFGALLGCWTRLTLAATTYTARQQVVRRFRRVRSGSELPDSGSTLRGRFSNVNGASRVC